MGLNTALKIIATLIIIIALILFVLPGIFWTAASIIFKLIILCVWGFIGYILIKIIDKIWKK